LEESFLRGQNSEWKIALFSGHDAVDCICAHGKLTQRTNNPLTAEQGICTSTFWTRDTSHFVSESGGKVTCKYWQVVPDFSSARKIIISSYQKCTKIVCDKRPF